MIFFNVYSGFERETSPDSMNSEHRVRIDITDTTDTEVEDEFKRKHGGNCVFRLFITSFYSYLCLGNRES